MCYRPIKYWCTVYTGLHTKYDTHEIRQAEDIIWTVVLNNHRLIKITNRTLDVSCNSAERACSTPTTRNSFGLLPQSSCERNTYNLEKTTSSVQAVIFINLWIKWSGAEFNMPNNRYPLNHRFKSFLNLWIVSSNLNR